MSYASTILADGPVSYWRLNETSGTAANDIADSNSGIYTGTYSLNAGALITDGTASSVNLTGSGEVRVSTPASMSTSTFTVEGWVKITALGGGAFGNQRLIAYGYYPVGGFGFGYNSSGNPLMTFFGGADYTDTSMTLTAGSTYYMAATYDGTNIRFYINGSLTNTISASAPTPPGSVDVYVGSTYFSGAPSDQLNGQLADVAIYSKVLGGTAFTTHYNAGKSNTYTDTPTGTLIFGGSLTQSKVGNDVRSGTLLIGGSLTQNKIGVSTPIGTLIFTGSIISTAPVLPDAWLTSASNIELLTTTGEILTMTDIGLVTTPAINTYSLIEDSVIAIRNTPTRRSVTENSDDSLTVYSA